MFEDSEHHLESILHFMLTMFGSFRYRDRHHGHNNLVQWNDVAFAVHALIITAYQAFQCLVYSREPGQKVSKITRAFLTLALAGSTVVLITCITGLTHHGKPWLEWIDFVIVLGWIKLAITLSKYLVRILPDCSLYVY